MDKITYLSLAVICLLHFSSCKNSGGDSTDSIDKLSSLESVKLPVGPKSYLPHLTVGGDKNLYMSWVEKEDSATTVFKFARYTAGNWTEPETIAKGTDWFVNWADYPMIEVDNNGNAIAHYLAKSDSGTYAYDVNLVLKPVNGQWSDPIIPHDDGTPTEHGFVTMLPQNDGTFLLAWLDGRNTGGGHGSSGAMTLRSAMINMKGTLSEEVELDGRICDCCQTGGVSTSNGTVIVYRDRSENEIRDMYAVRKMSSGWGAPFNVYQDDWNIKGCPVNGPKIAASDNGMAVAWFTAANSPEVKVAFSNNGGKSFDEVIVIDESDPLGRVDIVMLSESEAVVSWLDSGEEPAIKYQRVTAKGKVGEEVVVSSTSASRGSGFPQLEVHDGDMFFAWTSLLEDGSSTIKMAKREN